MSYSRRLIIASCVFLASSAQAYDVFIDPLYWQATETVDWALTNNLNATNQNITYKTIGFDFAPGLRVGVGCNGTWDTKFYYTTYYAKSTDSATGNLTSTFLGGKTVQNTNGGIFFRSGQMESSIKFNMLDWDLGKSYYATDAIMLRPIIGLRGGWINQNINTRFQGTVSAQEYVKNNFNGLGPKAALESTWILHKGIKSQFSIFADLTTSYLWGNWDISDVVHDSVGATIYTNVGSRDMGAFTAQAFVGLNYKYQGLALKLGYEIADWFDQYQVLDDGTGARNSDLILQGLTLRLAYTF